MIDELFVACSRLAIVWDTQNNWTVSRKSQAKAGVLGRQDISTHPSPFSCVSTLHVPSSPSYKVKAWKRLTLGEVHSTNLISVFCRNYIDNGS